jgi:hypothetical protein
MSCWRVRYTRRGDPHPVSRYHYGDTAEQDAREHAVNLNDQQNVIRVEVDRIERIERPDEGEGPSENSRHMTGELRPTEPGRKRT